MKAWQIILIALLVIIVGLLAFLVLREPGAADKPSFGQPESSAPLQPSGEQAPAQKSYISIAGMKQELSGTISPSEGKRIKGIVEITLAKVPADTEFTKFLLVQSGQKPTGQEVFGVDTDGSDGWGYIVNSNNFPNGIYDVIVIAGSSSGDEPLDAAVAQVVIEN